MRCVLVHLTHFLLRHQHISFGSSSSSWITPTWTSVQSCYALVTGIFTETGGQLHKLLSIHRVVTCAESLAHGDSSFIYRNATTLINFWKKWNIPFQKWCHRYFILTPWNSLTSVFTKMTWILDNSPSALPSHMSLLLTLIPVKTCLHTTSGKECATITSRTTGLPDVGSLLWGIGLITNKANFSHSFEHLFNS